MEPHQGSRPDKEDSAVRLALTQPCRGSMRLRMPWGELVGEIALLRRKAALHSNPSQRFCPFSPLHPSKWGSSRRVKLCTDMVSFSKSSSYYHYYYSSHEVYSYKAKRNITIIQPACNRQWEQRWCSSSSLAFREDRRDAALRHTACAQMNMFGGYFLLKQVGGGQYNMLQSLKRERC